MTVIQAFEEWEDIARNLSNAVHEYVKCFYDLDETLLRKEVLQEEVSEKEEQDIINKSVSLEEKIQNLYVDFLNKTNIVARAVEKITSCNSQLVDKLNKSLLYTFEYYARIIKDVKSLEKDFSQASSFIDLSKMERQKQLLSIKIVNFNQKFLASEGARLMTVRECEQEVKRSLLKSIEEGLSGTRFYQRDKKDGTG